MSLFHEMVAADIEQSFLDLDIFGEMHVIDDAKEPVQCVLDADQSNAMSEGGDLGIYQRQIVLYVREEDAKRKAEGQTLSIDGRIYTILQWRTDMGMHRVSLFSPRPMWG